VGLLVTKLSRQRLMTKVVNATANQLQIADTGSFNPNSCFTANHGHERKHSGSAKIINQIVDTNYARAFLFFSRLGGVSNHSVTRTGIYTENHCDLFSTRWGTIFFEPVRVDNYQLQTAPLHLLLMHMGYSGC
jgi:hypothetical protein